jgi:hypothetical protein
MMAQQVAVQQQANTQGQGGNNQQGQPNQMNPQQIQNMQAQATRMQQAYQQQQQQAAAASLQAQAPAPAQTQAQVQHQQSQQGQQKGALLQMQEQQAQLFFAEEDQLGPQQTILEQTPAHDPSQQMSAAQYVSHTQAQSKLRQEQQQAMLRGLRGDPKYPRSQEKYQQSMMRAQAVNNTNLDQNSELRQKAIQNNRNA